MAPKRTNPRTYSKKAIGATGAPGNKGNYKILENADHETLPSPAATASSPCPTPTNSNGTAMGAASNSRDEADHSPTPIGKPARNAHALLQTSKPAYNDKIGKLRAPTIMKSHPAQQTGPKAQRRLSFLPQILGTSKPKAKGKAKDETGATVIDPDIGQILGEIDDFGSEDHSSSSRNPTAMLKSVRRKVITLHNKLAEWRALDPPVRVSSLLPVIEDIKCATGSVIYELDTAETNRAIDVSDAMDRDERAAKKHQTEIKARIAAKDKVWKEHLQKQTARWEADLEKASAKRSDAEAVPTADGNSQAKLGVLRKLYNERIRKMKAESEAQIDAVKKEHAEAMHKAELQHKAEMAGQQMKLEELEKTLLEHNTRLAEENLRLFNLIDEFTSDQPTDSHNNSEQGIAVHENLSPNPIKIFEDVNSAPSSPAVAINPSNSSSPSIPDNEITNPFLYRLQETRKALATISSAKAIFDSASSPRSVTPDVESDSSADEAPTRKPLMNAIDPRNTQALRFIDSPGVSPSAGAAARRSYAGSNNDVARRQRIAGKDVSSEANTVSCGSSRGRKRRLSAEDEAESEESAAKNRPGKRMQRRSVKAGARADGLEK